MNNKKQTVITYIFFVVLTLVFVSLCFTNNVWLDEAFTATLVHTDMAGVLQRSMADTLPPLYNILLKITTSVFGYRIPIMKITSVAPMVATMLVGATTVRKRFGFITSIIFMTCITGMPMMLNYGIEIRMYSLGFLFATVSGIYAYELICDFNRKNCLIFSIISVLAGYSHHFAFVAVGFVYLFLLIYYVISDRTNIKRWFICLAITMGLYIPCAVVTLKQLKSVSGYFSMPDVDLHLFIQYAVYPFTTGTTIVSVLLLILVLILFGCCIYFIKYDSQNRPIYVYSLCCPMVFYGVLLFGTVISKIMTANIFVDRYLFFSMGLIWLFVAIMVNQIWKYALQMAPSKSNLITLNKCSITVAFSIFVIVLSFASTYYYQFKAEYDNPATEELSFISSNFSEGDIICTVEDGEEMRFCIPFYALVSGFETVEYEKDLNTALINSKQNNAKTWVIVKDGYDISGESLEIIQSHGLTPEYMDTFEFERYVCDVYCIR